MNLKMEPIGLLMKKVLFSILLMILGIPHLRSQEVTVVSAFDSTRIYIGDQVNFTVTVEQPADLALKLPLFTDTIIKNIEVLKGPDVDSVSIGSGRVRITEKYLVTSFDSGLYQIDPVYVESKNEDGIKRFFSDYARIEVKKYRVAPSDTTARIYDIIEPYKAPITASEVLPWALAAIVLAALVWTLLVFIKKRKLTKTGIPEIINPDPAHVIAFRELEKLRSEELCQKGHYKQYYTRLTEILRMYLENRYKVYSLELTTSETLHALLKTGFRKNEDYERLRTVLTAADLVKFAKYIPSNDENEPHFRNAWDFVDSTKEIIVSVPDEPVSNKVKEDGL